MQGHYVPRNPPDFLSEQAELPWRGESRWRDTSDQRIYTYDRRHGHVEVYNKRGNHLGVLDVVTGEKIGDAVKGRKIDV
ncbi:colicin E3/pyocin S6 family cytotoxin [Mycobacterium sp. C31M]